MHEFSLVSRAIGKVKCARTVWKVVVGVERAGVLQAPVCLVKLTLRITVLEPLPVKLDAAVRPVTAALAVPLPHVPGALVAHVTELAALRPTRAVWDEHITAEKRRWPNVAEVAARAEPRSAGRPMAAQGAVVVEEDAPEGGLRAGVVAVLSSSRLFLPALSSGLFFPAGDAAPPAASVVVASRHFLTAAYEPPFADSIKY